MPRLNLDYAAHGRPARWPRYVLLAAAVAITLQLLVMHADLQREAEPLQAQLDRAARRAQVAPKVDPRVARDIRQANEIIGQMTTPWNRLFAAVEAASSPRIALLAMTPDPKSGTVELSGEAADREALFEYLAQLGGQPGLRNVYLLSEQANLKDPAHPLRFVVKASWTESNSG